MADHEQFKSFIGISQIITAGLLLYNRTVILGAFLSIPIWMNILIWDMSFIGLNTPFTTRLLFYLLLTTLILVHYKQKVFAALKVFVQGTSTQFKYPIWAYLVLPIFAISLELLGAMPRVSWQWVTGWFNL
ncbi:hypothetical protein [Pedobacter sp.]|uniref:hypothetical protein n=1 Tax=Pedobacter sp. TaxID=1411316 RepID=UPI003396747C